MVNIPSYNVTPGEKIEIKSKEKTEKMVKSAMELSAGHVVPGWMNVNADKLSLEIAQLPKAEDIDSKINVQLIVELYSK